ncbi:MAG: glycosyltransferase family 4 protein [Bacteroidota bacterium]|nr:glycosyltransferase family 4 protein [Bacteroidota bacterium]
MKSNREALVILSPGFPKNEADSNCIPSLQVFVKALKEVCPGLNIIILTFQYPFAAGAYHWHGRKVISLGGSNKGGVYRLVTWLKAWRVLGKLNEKYHLIGILSFWLGECALVGNYFARRHSLSHYCWLQGQDAKKGNKYFKWIRPKANTLIALSDFLAWEFKTNYSIQPLYVIPSGIDTSLFGKAPVKRDIDVLGAGSLIPLKQFNLFIEAISFLKEFFPEINAVICGSGPEVERLQGLAIALNVEKNITFTGELPHTNVLALMQRSKIFLHPSNYEGFSTALSEALYAGCHVVSFCRPMNNSFRNHYVIANTTEMFSAVLSVLKNKSRKHEPVLTCPVQQTAKNVVNVFVG